jgi:hypothetical protein
MTFAPNFYRTPWTVKVNFLFKKSAQWHSTTSIFKKSTPGVNFSYLVSWMNKWISACRQTLNFFAHFYCAKVKWPSWAKKLDQFCRHLWIISVMLLVKRWTIFGWQKGHLRGIEKAKCHSPLSHSLLLILSNKTWLQNKINCPDQSRSLHF